MNTKVQLSSPASKRTILIVEDHPLTRRGMVDLIQQQSDLTVCGEVGTAREVFENIRTQQPDLVLADFTLPDKPGLELIKELHTLDPELLILVVSMHDENLYAERALRAGARGYIMKEQGGDKLLEAIRVVLAGNIYVSPSLALMILDLFTSGRHPTQQSNVAGLSDREFEVFQFIGQGLTTNEIGEQMRLSPKTVESHRLHIRQKLKLKTAPELIKHAVRWAGSQELL